MVQTQDQPYILELSSLANSLAKNKKLSTKIHVAKSEQEKFNAVKYFYDDQLKVLCHRVRYRSIISIGNNRSIHP